MKRHHSKSSLALTEMIIAILLFSITSVFCVQAFAKAYTLHLESTRLSKACEKAQNVAELLSNDVDQKKPFSNLSLIYPEIQSADNKNATLYMDEYFIYCPKDSTQKCIVMDISLSNENNPLCFHIVLSDIASEKELYSLDVACLNF